MKTFLKRYTPDAKTVKTNRQLRWLAKYFYNQNLWNFNRGSVSRAFSVGLFCAFVPVPFQMVIAAIGAIWFSANLVTAIALVWISNPITMPVIFYAAYKLGAWLLNVEITSDFVFSFEYFFDAFTQIWQPFLLGCFIFSLVSAIIGYFSIQVIYRWQVYKRIRKYRK